MPLKFQERGATDDFPAHPVSVALTVADNPVELALSSHFHEVGIALIEENGAIIGLEIVVELAFGTLYALKTAKSDRKSTRLNSSHANISYAVFCLKKKNTY